MTPPRPNHPFLTSWLRRTRKQLAPSGKLSELALILSQSEGNTPEHWAGWLRAVLEEEIVPTIDQLTAVDSHLARPKPPSAPEEPPFRLL